MIDRSDGLGLSFPGGLIHPWESAEKALKREIWEETGLEVTDLVFTFSYSDNTFYPNKTFVFEAQTRGDLRSSWEGTAVEVAAMEVRSRIMESQRQVLNQLLTPDQLDVLEREDSVLA